MRSGATNAVMGYRSMVAALDALFDLPAREQWRRAHADRATCYEEDAPPPLTAADLAAIRARARAATAGPWHWTHDLVNRYLRIATPRSARDRYAYLLQGPYAGGAGMDQHDSQVLGLHWSLIRGTSIPYPREEDMAFMAQARMDIPRLLRHIDRLDAQIAALRASVPARSDLVENGTENGGSCNLACNSGGIPSGGARS